MYNVHKLQGSGEFMFCFDIYADDAGGPLEEENFSKIEDVQSFSQD